jgi:putative Mn2+ efflux pump MntP
MTFIIFSLVISLLPFSVALNSSVYRCIEWKEALRMGLLFALFQTGMAMTGWGIGTIVQGWFYGMRVPVALFIMLFISFRYFSDSVRKSRELRVIATENMRILVGFAFVTSINTALLGISLGLLYKGVISFTGILAGMVFFMTILGIRAGKAGMISLARIAEHLAALVLFGSAVFILLQFLKIV